MSIYGFCENKCKHELDDVLNNALTYKGEIFKNVNWNDLEVGFYDINTYTGEGGSNYPDDELYGTLFALGRTQFVVTGEGIYFRRHNGTEWQAWQIVS